MPRPRNAHRIALGTPPELPSSSSETFSGSSSAPLAGSANRGSAPIPGPNGHRLLFYGEFIAVLMSAVPQQTQDWLRSVERPPSPCFQLRGK